MRDKEFNKGPWKQDNVEVEASRVIAGVIDLLQKKIVDCNQHSSEVVAWITLNL